jgi:hypothetical protein
MHDRGALRRGALVTTLRHTARCWSSAAPQGLRRGGVRRNDYRFVSERALEACSIHEVESISLVAVKPA